MELYGIIIKIILTFSCSLLWNVFNLSNKKNYIHLLYISLGLIIYVPFVCPVHIK